MNDTQQIEMAASAINPTLSPTIILPNSGGETGIVSLGVRGETFNGITLEAIGLTLVAGLCIWIITVFAFGIAVMLQHTNIAPRCTARHANTIWRSRRDIIADENRRRRREAVANANNLVVGGGESVDNMNGDGGPVSTRAQPSTTPKRHDNNIDNMENGGSMPGGGSSLTDPQSKTVNIDSSNNNSNEMSQQQQYYYTHPQDRGNPFLGWIPWTLHLSYDRMLRGIPGTGTRNKGMEGSFLGVNLDAIILFRYNALCLRVTAVVCVICITIILPLNLTSSCDTSQGDSIVDCSENTKLTNYGQTTIANIFNHNNITDPALLRLYVIAICTWYITYYVLKNVERDWKENLVLRRVYYLESDHYGNRQIELGKTLYNNSLVNNNNGGSGCGGCGDYLENNGGLMSTTEMMEEGINNNKSFGLKKQRGGNNATTTAQQKKEQKKKQHHRNPWIPNPEQRDTVPSIELYSVLVGGLPSLPDEVINSKLDMQTALGFSNRVNIDWQLAVATTFFDHCVPNQPGFSSSIVAVTILPGAPELAKAWRKWYAAAAALRRLRFIRSVIREKRYYSIDDIDDEEMSSKDNDDDVGMDSFEEGDDYDQEEYYEAYGASSVVGQQQMQTPSSKKITFADITNGVDTNNGYANNNSGGDSPTTVGRETSDIDYHIFKSLNYGPEQQAVYSREMAQGAAACCPNGCCEGRVKRQSIDKLLQMEATTVERLENAQYELKCAQMKAAVSTVDNGGGDKSNNNNGKNAVVDYNDAEEQHHHHQSSINGGHNNHDNSLSVEVSLQPNNNNNNNNGMSNGYGMSSDHHQFGVIDELATPTTETLSRCGSPRNAVLRMNAEGRFLFNSGSGAIMDATDEGADISDATNRARALSGMSSSMSSLRRRANTLQSVLSSEEGEVSKSSNQWNRVNSILRRTNTDYNGDQQEGVSPRNNQEIETGIWIKPSSALKSFMRAVKSDILYTLKAIVRWTKGKTIDKATSTLARNSTYAVVTFSSRQAAVAARHCLADGRGVQKWLSLETLPVAPLADAAPCDIITCRGCCRPVTLNLNQNQLMIRRYIALASLLFIYVFYTIPITLAQTLVSPQKLKETVPALHDWLDSTKWLSADVMSGLVSALLYTLFFALCPILFKGIANSGSRATSVQEAERYALKYYWYFMLVTAFAFTGLADTAISIYNHMSSDTVISSVEILLENIARQIPLTTAATWLNWIIVRTTMTLPLQYLLQINTFLFGCIGWKCCARCVMGGGPGGPIPYRIYIDGGTVFLCVVALAPQSPLVAPMALLYYLFCAPLWRRNCIFMYRPKFDTGGERWPFLSDILITSVFVGQFLLILQMVLKDAIGPAIFAGLPVIPTYLYRKHLLKTYKRAYEDAGLLQTSLLDGWDNTIPTTIESREEFRKFLVDAHKAAYIPVCIAGGATNILTAEPAVAIPSENDDMIGYGQIADTPSSAVNISSQRGAFMTPRSSRENKRFAWGDESATADGQDDAGCAQQ